MCLKTLKKFLKKFSYSAKGKWTTAKLNEQYIFGLGKVKESDCLYRDEDFND